MQKIMTDLNKTRSMKILEEMKKDLISFITDPIMQQIYVEDKGWSIQDYEDDKEQAQDILEKVIRRMESLGRYLTKKNNDVVAVVAPESK